MGAPWSYILDKTTRISLNSFTRTSGRASVTSIPYSLSLGIHPTRSQAMTSRKRIYLKVDGSVYDFLVLVLQTSVFCVTTLHHTRFRWYIHYQTGNLAGEQRYPETLRVELLPTILT